MRILSDNKFVFCLFLVSLSSAHLLAQTRNNTLIQDPKFEQLLNEKRKINPSLSVNDFYKIQIYNGGSEIAKKTLNEFRLEFTTIDATIVFNTPNYKVWVGNFRTRIEAERHLVDIKERYKNVLLIKPNR
jgi:hypothetical protein